jgi:ABC-2 type transport system permease protein
VKESKNKLSLKDFFGNIKKSFSGRKFRNGAYVTMVSAVVIVMVIVVDMIFTKLDIQYDLSNQGMYTLSKDTNKLIKNLNDDITIYYLAKTGSELDQFKNIVKQYDQTSSKIKVIYKDPVMYPQFAKKYTSETVNQNSFIVYDNKTKISKYVDYNDMLVQQTDPQTYQQTTTGIDVEGELTSAIQYVSTKNRPKMYIVSGHGEAQNGDTFSETMSKSNVETKSLKTITAKSIPQDCNILFINAPTSDFSATETQMIKDYLTKGGKAVITLDYNASGLKNLLSILDYYGIELVNGRVLEGDTSMCSSSGINILLPNIETHDITSQASTSSTPVVMMDAAGLSISKTLRSTVKVEPLLTTSDQSYAKVDPNSTNAEKEDGDISGPFNLGLVATDTYNNVKTNVVVYSSAITFTEDTATYGNS